MPKDKKKKPAKKKIGWWRFMAKWVFSPLLGVGKEATKELIPDEYKPLEDFAVLAIDVSEDMIKIHTDLEPNNKKQVGDWWKEHNSEIITTSLAVVMFAGKLAMDKINKNEPLSEEEKKHARIYKALKGL